MQINTHGMSVATIKGWLKKRLAPLADSLDDPELLATSEEKLSTLEELELKANANYSVCLLGQAGVGKSTLLNTLVADAEVVVPSGGGTGPLTANALKVSYSGNKSFRVKYHGRKKINELRFALDGIVDRAANSEVEEFEPDVAESADENDKADIFEDIESKSDGSLRSAKLLISGEQTGDRTTEYLADALRLILDNELKYQSEFLDEDLERIKRITETLYETKDGEFQEFKVDLSPNFKTALREHACGFLAPLIKELEISWPSEVLSGGIEIVDLPGIGIVSDVYANVTAQYLRKKAQSVMLVADSRGLRQEDALLLRDSGFLVRLMHSLDSPESDPVRLIVVVVKIDDVATENWRNDKSENGKALSSKAQHFDKVVENCKRDVRRQLVEFIQDVWMGQDAEVNKAKQGIIDRLSESLEVHPVSALQYRMLLEEDEDEHPFLKDYQSTNIPALRSELMASAELQKRIVQQRFSEGRQLFFDRIKAQLNTEIARREDNQLSPQMRHLKSQFEAFTNELNLEYNNRLGEFRNYLRQTVPGQIKDKVEIAAGRAEREIMYYLRSIESAHWGTLRAAVRRKGSFQGARNINLPQDFALRFEEPLAEVWSTEILQGLRNETSRFTKSRANAVKKIDDWVRENEITPPPLLTALIDDLNVKQQGLESSESDAVEEMRSKVRSSLQEKIEEPIREGCTKFVAANDDIGKGVKQRILQLFEELATIAVEAARGPAHELLSEQFKTAEDKLLKDLNQNQNPIEQVLEAFTESGSGSFEEKGPSVEEIRSVLDAMPLDVTQNEVSHAPGQI